MNRIIIVAALTCCTFLLLGHSANSQDRVLSLKVVDANTGMALPARIYLEDEAGKHYFFASRADDGTAVRYEKQNWLNKKSVEYHTTVSAHDCYGTIPPGKYTLTVERGKTYYPESRTIEVTDHDVTVEVRLRNWIDMSARHWYSGDLHIHRSLEDLPNIVRAENLNVVFPLTNWVTISDTAPSDGNKNLAGNIPGQLIKVGERQVIWPRNTEYEIFTVAGKRHTLGALFVLGHKGPLRQTVPPWAPVIEAARNADPDILFDMDKLSWPFAMLLPTLAPRATYEITNNHIWRTEFAFREWYTPTPGYIQPPFGGKQGGERDWIDFTLGMYYTLLNCGFRMPPSAGTANGVHPVPAGFGRVYVHLPGGFDYQKWRKGLQAGRSFVTTGPMLFATAAQEDPGHLFRIDSDSEQRSIPLHMEVISEQPLTFGELIVNGRPEILLRTRNEKTPNGSYRSVIEHLLTPTESGWFALRFWEDRPGGRVRFAHSAPWYVEVDNLPVRPRYEEKQYLVNRMRDEIQRSRGVVAPAGIEEYENALQTYLAMPTRDDAKEVQQSGRELSTQAERTRWLENMIVHHRFAPHEVRLATGMSIEDAIAEVNKRHTGDPADETRPGQLRILPYPGGRHPRRGFLDGAIHPQRETKISIFPPWKNGGYAVVDVPEAVFSNLGLTYLAHEHIPTIWTEKSIELEKLEWLQKNGGLEFERKLPNGISLGSRVHLRDDAVAMKMWLTNETGELLTGLRSQVCVMLKGLIGFNSQRPREKVVREPFVAVRGDESNRWIITAWRPINRAWTNPPVPCIHSDPIFPDCPPGETVHVNGAVWFYEGEDIETEIKRLAESFSS